MPKQMTHPSREELSAYSLGQLPQDRAVVIDSHISECGSCCQTLVGLSSDDTFVALLQEAKQLPKDQLPTDQTVDIGDVPADPSSALQEVPAPLAKHARYEIVSLIGKGGMGDVYKARHRMMDRTVALKIINRELVRKSEAVDRFHREVKTAAQLSHPNIVTAHDAEQADDLHFLVMEYVDGTDLSQVLKDRGALPINEACDYIRQAAIGLQHAHEQGMVHRDIKPHNLMVTEDGMVKVLDFGLASLAPEALADSGTVVARSDLTAAGAIMGTPDFISPEQADDARRADIRSDIYSLGASLYFLLSGQPPFTDCSIMHKLKNLAQAEPESLQSLRDDIPAELAAVVSRMMAKNRDERYKTPADVAEAVAPFAVGSHEALASQDTASVHTEAKLDREEIRSGLLGRVNRKAVEAGNLTPQAAAAPTRRLADLLWFLPIVVIILIGYWSHQQFGSVGIVGVLLGLYGLAYVAILVPRVATETAPPLRRIVPKHRKAVAFLLPLCIVGGGFEMYGRGQFSSKDSNFLAVTGGSSVSSDRWWFSSGGTYLNNDEPGVLFGIYEDPTGNRDFTYVVLIRHNASDLANVSNANKAGLNFDGQVASMQDGITIDGKGIELDVEVQVDANRIKSTKMTINGNVVDASQGRLLLVDLTSDVMTWKQVHAAFPTELPDRNKLSESTETISRLAKQLAQLDGVRPFLASAPAAEIITTEATFKVVDADVEFARRLVGRREHLTFTELKTLSPEVAAILARHPANLSFPALQQISPEVAKALSGKQQHSLQLDGLQEMSHDIARELASANCALSLRGVSAITPEVAESLIKPGGTLSLGLTAIPPDVASVLAKHSGWLSLDSLRTIDAESAAALAEGKHRLSLNGLNWLSPDVAKALGNYDGDHLDLNGLPSLDLATANKLAQARCQGGLHLDGLTTVTSKILEALANGNSGFSVQGLKEIDTETKQTLEKVGDQLRKQNKLLLVRDLGLVSVRATSEQMNQIAELLDAWKRLPDPSAESDAFARKINTLYDELKTQRTPNTENWRRLWTRIAVLSWPHLASSIPQPMAQTLADLTKPYADIRKLDRLAEQDRPTEALGWDVQAAHALALARAGKTKEALEENEALMKKIAVNLRWGRLPDVTVEFLGTQRSKKSLLKQSLLQKALILAIAGKPAESAKASETASLVEIQNQIPEDQAAIQAMLHVFAQVVQ